jgi:hypothetical protein
MHDAVVAEWILSLVVAPDRATSTAGDLVEEASSRGTLWFWFNVLRTASSHLWHDLSASPWRMLGRGLWGVAATWVLSVMFGLLISMWRSALFESVPTWENPLILVLMCTAWPLLVGWEVGRRSDGRELPAAFAVATLFAAIYVVNQYRSSMQGRQFGITGSDMHQYAFAIYCAQALFVIAGAILFRRRRHKLAYARPWR